MKHKIYFVGLFLIIGLFLLSGCDIFKDFTDERPIHPDSPNTDQPQLTDLAPPINEEIYPVCGNGKCERFNGIDELTSCQKDCNFNTPLQKPVCGNGKCEVYGGVDEFYSCGYGTANDCGVKCSREECWVDYCFGTCGGEKPICGNGRCEVFQNIDEFVSCPNDCGIVCGDGECVINPVDERIKCPQDCQNGGEIILNPPSQDSGGTGKNYKVKVYYAYNSGKKDTSVLNNIKPTFNEASNVLKNYNGITFSTNVQEVVIDFTINSGHDIYYTYSERQQIWRAIDKKVDLKSDINNYDSIWLVLAGTQGGCFGIDYKTPIYCDGDHFSSSNSVRIIGTIHEFLHSFGCKDINEGKKGCIMGDIYINTISDSTLCECKNLFKPENYGKHPYSEYVGSSFVQQSIIRTEDKEKVYTSPFQE